MHRNLQQDLKSELKVTSFVSQAITFLPVSKSSNFTQIRRYQPPWDLTVECFRQKSAETELLQMSKAFAMLPRKNGQYSCIAVKTESP